MTKSIPIERANLFLDEILEYSKLINNDPFMRELVML